MWYYIKREAGFMFGRTPELTFTSASGDTGAVDEAQSVLDGALRRSGFKNKLIQAGRDCFIGKRIAIKVSGGQDSDIRVSFRPSFEFVYSTMDDDCDTLSKIIFFYILESDLLILSFPLYCYGMPAPLKAFMDRTLPLSSMAMQKVGERYEHVGQADFSRLRYLMICGCGFPNSKHNFEPAVAQFELMFPHNHTVMTVPESPMFSAPEAAEVTAPRLELVKRAGRQYASTGTIDQDLLSEIGSPMIPEETYAAIVNGGVK